MAASAPSLPAKRWARLSGFAQKTVQPETDAAFEQDGREFIVDGGRVFGDMPGERFTLDAHHAAVGIRAFDAAIGHDDGERQHVVRRDAVKGNVGAGGIIGNHAAERRAGTGGDIRPETKSVRFEESVELIQHDARADADGAFFQVQIGNAAVVAGEIYDETLAERATDEAGARAARNDRHRGIGGRADDGGGLIGGARKGDRRRFDLINRGVGGVKLARQVVKRDVAIRGGEGRLLLVRNHA